MEAGAIVVLTAKKRKHLYNGFKAKVMRINTHQVVLTILEGPQKGDKRKVPFSTVEVIEDNPGKKAKVAEAPAAAAPAAEDEAPAAEAPVEDEKPDNKCMALFGDLNFYN